MLTNEEWRTPAEVTQILRISRTKLWRITSKGEIASYKVGGSRRYRLADIEAYLASVRDVNEKDSAA